MKKEPNLEKKPGPDFFTIIELVAAVLGEDEALEENSRRAVCREDERRRVLASMVFVVEKVQKQFRG